MPCKGRCEGYRARRGCGVTPYMNSAAWCSWCALYLKWEGRRCPCCNEKLRRRRGVAVHRMEKRQAMLAERRAG